MKKKKEKKIYSLKYLLKNPPTWAKLNKKIWEGTLVSYVDQYNLCDKYPEILDWSELHIRFKNNLRKGEKMAKKAKSVKKSKKVLTKSKGVGMKKIIGEQPKRKAAKQALKKAKNNEKEAIKILRKVFIEGEVILKGRTPRKLAEHYIDVVKKVA